VITDLDPLAARRQQLAEYLLGPARPDATTRWNTATEDLIAASRAMWPSGAAVRPREDADRFLEV
jgi:hypothetical protein